MQISDYKNILNKKLYQKDLLKKDLKTKNTQSMLYKKQFENLIKSQNIIQEVAKLTQNEIKFFICDVVNYALNIIPFENKPDSFEMEFVTRRNQSECDLYFMQKSNRINNLMLGVGGGILNIVSFALLLACWSLQEKKNNTIIFDEPFKDINDPEGKLNLKEFIGEMIKNLSEKLNLQLIIIGSNNDYVEIADKVIEVKLINSESKIY